jgi:diacylglycerol kinase family enzyme
MPFARPDDGFLNVLLFKDIGPLATLMVLPRYVKGKTPSNCKVLKAKQIKISSNEPLQIQLDGEVFFDSDITIEVKPAAVQFITVNDLTYESKANKK